jgi:hypothetical protein
MIESYGHGISFHHPVATHVYRPSWQLDCSGAGLIAMNGTVSIYMNDGVTQETIELISPNQCLLVEPKDWHTMTFGPSAILMVLSSHTYDRSEYIDTPYENKP